MIMDEPRDMSVDDIVDRPLRMGILVFRNNELYELSRETWNILRIRTPEVLYGVVEELEDIVDNVIDSLVIEAVRNP